MATVLRIPAARYGGHFGAVRLPNFIREIPFPYDTTLQEESLFELLDRRWAIFVIRALSSGPKRFNEISKSKSINSNTLTARLKELEIAGLVEREVFHFMPPHVEYRLTSEGHELARFIRDIGHWARTWSRTPGLPRTAAVSMAAETPAPYGEGKPGSRKKANKS